VEHHPPISVVIPVFNGEGTVARAIESALSQELRPFEVVVVDDGSTDRTPGAAGGFGERVTFVTQPHAGAAAARNRALREAHGEFVAFLDADDEFLPGRLEAGVAPMMTDAEVGATFCRVLRGYPDGSADVYGEAYHRSRAFPEHLWPSSFVQTSGATCRRSVLQRVGPIDESLRCHDELDLWIRIGEVSRVVEIPRPLAVFHDTPGSYSKRWDGARSEADFYRVIEKALDRCPDRYRPHREVIMADAHLHWGILYLVRGDHRRARPFLRRSLAARPSTHAALLLAGSFLPRQAIRTVLNRAKRMLSRSVGRPGPDGRGSP
jgi:glycosyltransferase involved in cell wall biosynthesis